MMWTVALAVGTSMHNVLAAPLTDSASPSAEKVSSPPLTVVAVPASISSAALKLSPAITWKVRMLVSRSLSASTAAN